MALSPEITSQLYKRYLGRDPNAGELAGQGRLAEFNTPEKLEGLLSSTSSSIRGKTTQTIQDNINQLKGGQQLFGGQLPDFNTYQQQNPELQAAETSFDTGLSEYDILTQKAAASPDKTKSMLKQGSWFLGETREDLEKKFGDPNSPWYIPDSNAQRGVIDNAMEAKSVTMNDIVGKVQSLYEVLTTAASNELAGKRDKLEAIRKNVEKAYDTLFSYYGEERAAERDKESAAQEHQYKMAEIGASRVGGGRDTATERATEEDRKYYKENANLADDQTLESFIRMDEGFRDWFTTNRGIPYFQAGSSPEGKYTVQDLSKEYMGGYLEFLQKTGTTTGARLGTQQTGQTEQQIQQEFFDDFRAGMPREDALKSYPELGADFLNSYYTQ